MVVLCIVNGVKAMGVAYQAHNISFLVYSEMKYNETSSCKIAYIVNFQSSSSMAANALEQTLLKATKVIEDQVICFLVFVSFIMLYYVSFS